MRFSIARTIGFITVVGALAALPTLASAQATASICKDGTPSAASGRGACAGHGGVDAAATKTAMAKARADARAAKASAKASAKAEKTAEKKAEVKADMKETKAARSNRPAAAHVASARPRATSAAPTAASSGAKDDNDPTNALAQCNDGMYSHASNRRGACSRHGGVKSWMHG